jgi:hypothetical protein
MGLFEAEAVGADRREQVQQATRDRIGVALMGLAWVFTDMPIALRILRVGTTLRGALPA